MIVRKQPSSDEDLRHADLAWFNSNASDNALAIREINAEAEQYGLIRTREFWLQQFTFDNHPVFRGFCFRMEPSGIGRRLEEARRNDVIGTPASQIVRDMRDTGA